MNSNTSMFSSRVERFTREYKKRFKTDSFDILSTRDFVRAEVLQIMKGPLTLYASGMNGQVLIDLVGWKCFIWHSFYFCF